MIPITLEAVVILILAAGANVVIGLMIFLANPSRGVNRSFGILSIITTLWIGALCGLTYSKLGHSVIWIRLMVGLGGFVPWAAFLLKDSILRSDASTIHVLRKNLPLLLLAIVHLILVHTQWFIPEDSVPGHEKYGWVYYIHIFLEPAFFTYLAITVFLESNKRDGIVKVDLQVFILTGCLCFLVGIGLTSFSSMIGWEEGKRLSPIALVGFYALAGFTMTTRKIFEPRHISRNILRFALVFLLSILLYLGLKDGFHALFSGELSEVLALVFCLALIIPGNRYLEKWIRTLAERETIQSAETVLKKTYNLGKKRLDEDHLIQEFYGILQSWAGCEKVTLFQLDEDELVAGDIRMNLRSPECRLLRLSGWETRESLDRVRASRSTSALIGFMQQHDFHLLLCISDDDQQTPPQLMIGLNERLNKYPYTWNDCHQMVIFLEAFLPLLNQANVARQIRNQEQLASAGMLAASLAHEIRNPMVAIKTFFQLLPKRYDDPKFRDQFSGIIQEEVKRIEDLTQNLLDSTKPSVGIMAPVSLKEIASAAMDLIAHRARQKGVTLSKDFAIHNDHVKGDRSALRQVCLNLLFNAIDAIDEQSSEKSVTFRAYKKNDRLWLSIDDTGTGMTEEVRRNIFKPFFSTKTHGFGLGLTVTTEILKEHGALTRIQSSPEKGTSFAIGFLPCPE